VSYNEYIKNLSKSIKILSQIIFLAKIGSINGKSGLNLAETMTECGERFWLALRPCWPNAGVKRCGFMTAL
jgi:hypothetical protein